jgi:hypothetical protein
MSRQIKLVTLAIVLLAILLLVTGCAPTMPARQEEMTVADAGPGVGSLGSICVTVYGNDVGGLASHYYPLPREDFESALLESLSASGVLVPVTMSGDPDYLLTVGLIRLVQPQGSGRVTLETSWTVTSAVTGERIARRSIEVTTPATFFKKQEATETAARLNIAEGLSWMERVVALHDAA